MTTFLKYYLIAGLLLFPLLLSAQISNVQVSAEGSQIIITYDFTSQSESIDDIIVTYSYTSGDETKSGEAKQVTGDVFSITPGTRKRIVWNPLSEMESFAAENLVIHLTGVRDQTKQATCENNLRLANQFFAAKGKGFEDAIFYYNEILNCRTCNCHPKDVAYATEQIRIAEREMKTANLNDGYHVSYLFDMATAKGGNSMHGISAFLLRNNGFGYYASFRSDKNFYAHQNNMSYYEDYEALKGNYELTPLANTRISSWLFSAGITRKLKNFEHAAAYLYGGVGIGTNSIAGEYHIAERGHTDNLWITNGMKNLFISPEVGIIANVYDYVSIMAGVKYPLSMTAHEALKTKGLSFMVGAGIKLKTIEKNSYAANANTYVAYTLDLPDRTGPDKIQSINIIGISAGTVSYHKVGGYISLRINPLLFSTKEATELTGNAVYTGVYDHANAFATAGLTWMYFYAGIGLSYQKEYKIYEDAGAEIWNSQRNKIGFCTEFGVNLRLFDSFLLRGGVTFPDFRLSNRDNVFAMGSNKMFLSLGLGYVLPTN